MTAPSEGKPSNTNITENGLGGDAAPETSHLVIDYLVRTFDASKGREEWKDRRILIAQTDGVDAGKAQAALKRWCNEGVYFLPSSVGLPDIEPGMAHEFVALDTLSDAELVLLQAGQIAPLMTLRDLRSNFREWAAQQGKVLSHQDIDALIDTMTLSPIQIRTQARDDASLYLSSHGALSSAMRACTDAGVPASAMQNGLRENRFPYFGIDMTPGLARVLSDLNLVYGIDDKPGAHYYLDLLDDGRLFVKYQQIIGSRMVGELTAVQMRRLTDRMRDAIMDREQPPSRAQRAARLNRQAAGSAPAAVPSAEAVLPVGATLADQVALLRQEDDKLLLPTVHLPDYAKIRSLFTDGGGVYSSKGYFKFRNAEEARAVLQAAREGRSHAPKKTAQFFGTPKALAREVCADLGDLTGLRVLEPEAGDGALADAAMAAGAAEIVTVENWAPNVQALQSKGYSPLDCDFLALTPADIGLVDCVAMNPPFSKRQDIAHVLHALRFVKSTGRLSAIISPAFQRQSRIKALESFRELMDFAQAKICAVPAGTFRESGTMVATTRVVLDMPTLVRRLRDTGRRPEDFGFQLGFDLDEAADELEEEEFGHRSHRQRA